ncbi:SAM-dependent methyltransferase [Inhella inkyongensis]|uniref:SAM-dependent methyltransferase n=1 Tax=Inhella inkyongensis TaxID=392593 RepID=A0A840S2J6_9BURK|nr:class I SAM-dependent methyltransferase [Inhella inkyongensis]MBB5205417.1 SAM-dependent methyltransferase [Inhella inkyongensis]
MSRLSRPAASASGVTPLTAQARFWNRIARKYAADAIADLPGYEATLDRVRALLQPQQTVLELGCGTGSTALRLAPQVRSYLGTDLAPEMITIARERLALQPTPGLRFAVADAADAADAAPQRPAPGFDALLAFNLLHLLPDLDASLAQLLKPLKSGGLFISKTACVGEMNPLIPWLAIPVARVLGKAPPVRAFKAPTLVAALERQGLQIEAEERHGTKGKDIRIFVVARKP